MDQATHTAYDPEGRVIATWGATYPVAYAYDPYGRMSAMATTRDPAHESVNLLTLLSACVSRSDPSDKMAFYRVSVWGSVLSTPRANRTILPGGSYHLTHRCHGRTGNRTELDSNAL